MLHIGVIPPSRLFGSLPNQYRRSTRGGSRNLVGQGVSIDRKRSLLLGAFPVRIQGVLNLEDDGAVSHPVAAPMGVAALHCRLVLLRCPCRAGPRKFGSVWTTNLQRIATTGIERENAHRVWTKGLHL